MTISEGQANASVLEVDAAFLGVLDDVLNLTLVVTSEAVQQIMHASSGFIDETVQKAITEFHSLYSQATAQQTVDINREVDSLIDQIRSQVDNQVDTNVDVIEDDEKRKARLSLSAVQKRLETLIQFDTNAKDKLVPVLMSMQFEDELRQVITHIKLIWHYIANDVLQNDTEVAAVHDYLKSVISTRFEKDFLYHFVLKEPPPPNIVDDDSEFAAFVKGLL